MRLHIGCGPRVLDDWTNIDVQRHPDAPRDPEILAHAKSVPLGDATAVTIMAIHLWEHFYRWECEEVIREWRRLLRPGGNLILELPDLEKCCRNILEGYEGKHPGQLGMWGLYGDPRTQDPYMCHRWGWTPTSIKAFLKHHGFVRIHEAPTQYHPTGRERRDMRIECTRA